VTADLGDAELLRLFAGRAGAAEAAFGALVRRHGPLVLHACRAALRNEADAEDAFQATFLVLAANARTLNLRGPLGAWLCGVARRVAGRARVAAARRSARERRAAVPEAQAPRAPEPDLAGAVHDALKSLPAPYREAVVLCDLQGATCDQAAAALGLTRHQVRCRLARGRQRLRATLARRGLAPAAAVTVGALTVRPALAAATARAAALVAAGLPAEGSVPKSVLALSNAGVFTMLTTKVKSTIVAVFAGAAVAAGAYGLSAQAPPPRPDNEPARTPPPPAEGVVDFTIGTDSGFTTTAAAADPGEELATLLAEARRRRGTGDVAGARQALRRVITGALAWEEQLADEALKAAARRQGAGDRFTPAIGREVPVFTEPPAREPRTTSTAPVVGTTIPPKSASADVEGRLREVERKLDRLMEALERRPEPRPGRQ
jgi:RNA polymerase sigma factor (sigma-70 family)